MVEDSSFIMEIFCFGDRDRDLNGNEDEGKSNTYPGMGTGTGTGIGIFGPLFHRRKPWGTPWEILRGTPPGAGNVGRMKFNCVIILEVKIL